MEIQENKDFVLVKRTKIEVRSAGCAVTFTLKILVQPSQVQLHRNTDTKEFMCMEIGKAIKIIKTLFPIIFLHFARRKEFVEDNFLVCFIIRFNRIVFLPLFASLPGDGKV